ncbi:MAG: ABC transporter substrate-binding protein [Bdellovibrionales bacterium]|nr:ABC transporter substrate-binding protein [Ramlibacter sp.]
MTLQFLVLLAALAALACAAGASAQEKVSFATNWKAQAGHGGFYQALVDGTYTKYGLSVEIQQGGPQVNGRQLLAAGKIDFLMAGKLPHPVERVKNDVPIVVVASLYAATIEARVSTARTRPETVRKFVAASMLGWETYLYGNNLAANEVIKKANPDMTDEELAASVALMKKLRGGQ